eukprot:12915189-Ditylum_brightwellii.AAC.1
MTSLSNYLSTFITSPAHAIHDVPLVAPLHPTAPPPHLIDEEADKDIANENNNNSIFLTPNMPQHSDVIPSTPRRPQCPPTQEHCLTPPAHAIGDAPPVALLYSAEPPSPFTEEEAVIDNVSSSPSNTPPLIPLQPTDPSSSNTYIERYRKYQWQTYLNNSIRKSREQHCVRMAARQRRNCERNRQQRTATVTTAAVLTSVYAADTTTHQDTLSSSDEEDYYASMPFIGFDSSGGGGKISTQSSSNDSENDSEFPIDSCSVSVVEEENVGMTPAEMEREEDVIMNVNEEPGNASAAEATIDGCFEK